MSSTTSLTYSESLAKGDRISPQSSMSEVKTNSTVTRRALGLRKKSKSATKDKDSHKPGDGDKKIHITRLSFQNAFFNNSEVGSTRNRFFWWNNDTQSEASALSHFLRPRSSQVSLETNDSVGRSSVCRLSDFDDTPYSSIGPTSAKRVKRSCLTVTSDDMQVFFRLLADEHIQDFLRADSCKKIADKYLLAMVFAYFKRADFTLEDYTTNNFFTALYLAHDVEEDEEEIKDAILPWALGVSWRNNYIEFLQERDMLFERIDYRAIVSRRCCEEIMAQDPDCMIWKRSRPEHHGGALRIYSQGHQYRNCLAGPHQLCQPCIACVSENPQISVPKELVRLAVIMCLTLIPIYVFIA